ncbi:hypothetical protein U2P60_13580 [Brucella sp. H1_1004]|uniref:hypothetical protein n=1 Tax=Brucella sp. H1_1004 TaxID=3110109 RepID=UPI0039B666B3
MASAAIRLPFEKVEQARQLAAHHNVTISALISRMITDEIKSLGLEDRIGINRIRVKTFPNGTFEFDCGIGLLIWTSEQALDVAHSIERSADGVNDRFNVDSGLSVSRVGLGIRLFNMNTGEERMLAPMIAKELAEMLRRVVAAAAAKN